MHQKMNKVTIVNSYIEIWDAFNVDLATPLKEVSFCFLFDCEYSFLQHQTNVSYFLFIPYS